MQTGIYTALRSKGMPAFPCIACSKMDWTYNAITSAASGTLPHFELLLLLLLCCYITANAGPWPLQTVRTRRISLWTVLFPIW